MGISNTASIPNYGHTIRPTRGSVYMCEFVFPDGTGSEEVKERPCLIVSVSNATSANGTVTIIPFTSKESLPMATHAVVTLSNGVSSTALCEYIKTIAKNDLGKYQCQIDKSYIPAINRALLAHLGLTPGRYITAMEALEKSEFVLKVANFMQEAGFPFLDVRKAIRGVLEMICDNDILKEPDEVRKDSKAKLPKQVEAYSSEPPNDEDQVSDAPIDNAEGNITVAEIPKFPRGFNTSSEYVREKLELQPGEYLLAEIARNLNKHTDNIYRIVEKFNLKSPEYCRLVGKKYIYNEKAVDKIVEYLSKRGC